MTKVISISDKAYEKLSELKHKGESFTDIVLDLTKKEAHKPISSFAGVWKGREDLDLIFEEIKKERETAKLREVKF